MPYSKDLSFKFFGLESHPFSLKVMSTNGFFDSAKFSIVMLIVCQGTYKKPCDLFNFLLSNDKKLCSLFNFLWSNHKKLGSLILKVESFGGGFLLYLQI